MKLKQLTPDTDASIHQQLTACLATGLHTPGTSELDSLKYCHLTKPRLSAKAIDSCTVTDGTVRADDVVNSKVVGGAISVTNSHGTTFAGATVSVTGHLVDCRLDDCEVVMDPKASMLGCVMRRGTLKSGVAGAGCRLKGVDIGAHVVIEPGATHAWPWEITGAKPKSPVRIPDGGRIANDVTIPAGSTIGNNVSAGRHVIIEAGVTVGDNFNAKSGLVKL